MSVRNFKCNNIAFFNQNVRVKWPKHLTHSWWWALRVVCKFRQLLNLISCILVKIFVEGIHHVECGHTPVSMLWVYSTPGFTTVRLSSFSITWFIYSQYRSEYYLTPQSEVCLYRLSMLVVDSISNASPVYTEKPRHICPGISKGLTWFKLHMISTPYILYVRERGKVNSNLCFDCSYNLHDLQIDYQSVLCVKHNLYRITYKERLSICSVYLPTFIPINLQRTTVSAWTFTRRSMSQTDISYVRLIMEPFELFFHWRTHNFDRWRT